MKQKKTHFSDKRFKEEDDYEFIDHRKDPNRSKDDHKRRPIKNWKKVWIEHSDEADEFDEFYVKK